MTPCFTLPDRPMAAIDGGSEGFPVGRIFCIGRNYRAHAEEMGMDAREAPFFFTKWAEALVPGGGTVPYPPETQDYQFEAELVLAIGRPGAAVAEAQAPDLIFGYAVGLDMTRRDLQAEARGKSRPWDTAKNFAHSAPLGPIRLAAAAGGVDSAALQLRVNGAVRQNGRIADMIWNCREILAYISRFERLLPGDLVYTGTPAGVGPVRPGDVLDATIEGLPPLRVTIGEKEPPFR